MNFKIWLEYQEKDFNYYKNLILGMLNLESPEGLSASLDSFKPDILISSLEAMGEFKELNSDVQQQVKDKIQVGEGSIEDLIRLMVDDSD